MNSERLHALDSARRLAVFALAVIIAGACGGCRRDDPNTERRTPAALEVYVSIPPQKYFAERVGGKHVSVRALLAPGQSPHVFEPTPQVIARAGQADVFFKINMPFEAQVVDKLAASTKNLHIVDTSAGIQRVAGAVCTDPHHHHDEAGNEHAHAHDGDEIDPHIWMDPTLVKTMAANMRDALAELDPAHAEDYAANYAALAADLDALDADIAAQLAPAKGKAFFVFHPACGYFARRYGLRQVAIEAGGKAPHARQLATLIEEARAAGAKLIFVQPQFDTSNAEVIAKAINGAVAPLDPLAENYLENLRQMAAEIRDALTPAATQPGA